MSFLNPWLWCGLGALAAPVWLHLQRRTDRQARLFPGMRFLDPAPVAQQSPLSFRDWLLFLLRLLVVTLLTTALAWPYTAGEATKVSVNRVYILDNTLSAQADSGFERDRDTIRREIGRLPDSTLAAVVELTSKARTVVTFGDSREHAQEKLAVLVPTAERGPYLAAFRQAQALLDRAIGERREIVFYGDNQANQWSENTDTLGFLRNIEVTMGRVADRPTLDNAAIHVTGIKRIFRGDSAQLQCNGQLLRSGRPGKGTVVIEVNGQERLRRVVNFDSAAEKVPISAMWEGHPTEWIQGRMWIEHEKDALLQDDVAWFAAAPVVEGKVAVLARSSFLLAALSQKVMQGHWQMDKINPSQLEVLLENKADVLVLEASYLQSGVVREAVDRFLGSGRGVFIQVDRVSPIVTEALRKLGFEVNEPVTPTGTQPIEKFLASHRVMSPFTSPDFGNVFEVDVLQHRQLQVLRGTGIVFSKGGDVLLADGIQEAGRILVSAFGFSREQTNWVVDPSFVPFLDLALQYLRQDSAEVAFLEPGEIWRVALANGEKAQKLVLRQKDRVLEQTVVGSDRIAKIRVPGTPGLYELSYDEDPAIKRMVAVGIRPEESLLTYEMGTPSVLESWKMAPEVQKIPNPEEKRNREIQPVRRQNIWWWVLLAGLGMMALESLLVARKGRRTGL